MQTTTFQDVVFAACEQAKRTRDQLPPQEYVSLQFFIAAYFLQLWNKRPWSDLIPPILQVTAANRQFSKQPVAGTWLGQILGVYHSNPQTCDWRRARAVAFYLGDDVVYVDTNCTNLYVEYMLPYPSAAWPDLTQLTNANFMAAKCPLRFRNILMHRAAGYLLNSDMEGSGNGQFQLAEDALVDEVNRDEQSLPPWRRQVRLSFPRRGRRF